MKKMVDKNVSIVTVVVVSLIVAVIASVATVSLTGNVIGVNKNDSSLIKVYQKVEIDQKLTNVSTLINSVHNRINSLSYLNPGDCEFKQIRNSNSTDIDTGILCRSNQIVGAVTHIDCPVGYQRVVASTSWMGNSLPMEINYACESLSNGVWIAPQQVMGYCCNYNSNNYKAGVQHVSKSIRGNTTFT